LSVSLAGPIDRVPVLVPVVLCVEGSGHGHLAHVGRTDGRPRSLAGGTQAREQNRDKKGDNGDDHQQLDERESGFRARNPHELPPSQRSDWNNFNIATTPCNATGMGQWSARVWAADEEGVPSLGLGRDESDA
jgi:hypothetical protein